MLKLEKWKIWLVLIVSALSVLYSMPSLLPLFGKESPSFMPSQKLNLGLDLRGGSHLLFEADVANYMREQMENLAEDVKQRLRSDKIAFLSVNYAGDVVKVAFSAGANPDEIKTALSSVVSGGEFTVVGEVLEIRLSEQALRDKKKKLIEQAIEIVRRRVDQTGTVEPIIQRQGEGRILLQVPGLQDPSKLKNLIGKTAKMTFHLLPDPSEIVGASPANPPSGAVYYPYDEHDDRQKGGGIFVQRRVQLSGEALVESHATNDQYGRPAVSFRFDTTGARKFGDITRNNSGKQFAIVLDGKVISAPVINEPILGGSGIITGMGSSENSQDLALLLRAGALPVPLKVIEERTVGPSLGADSVNAGKIAAGFSLCLIMGFMILYYSLFGVFSCCALLVNLFIIVAGMAVLGSTLTLPGIAGIVLSLGMAVDANVLIYERIKEEIRAGKTVYSAVQAGFDRAFITIFDSNLTTLISAFILFAIGSGTIKGFAVTLAIGIMASMFTAIMMNRLLVYRWIVKNKPSKLPI